MIEATILVPTHAERPCLELSLRSALQQTVENIEVLVVGDGCPDSTRVIVERLALEDERIRFFDNAKGERHGEAHRHTALLGARGRIVSYLSDDDLLFPDHIEVAAECLKGASFLVARPCFVPSEGMPYLMDGDVTSERWIHMIAQTKRNFVPLTGTSHTLELYRALDVGWSPAPREMWTDLYMWRKFFAHDKFTAIAAPHPTCLVFPSPERGDDDPSKRLQELEHWASVVRDDGRRRLLERQLLASVHDLASLRTLLYEGTLAAEKALEARAAAADQQITICSRELAATTVELDRLGSEVRELTKAKVEAEETLSAHDVEMNALKTQLALARSQLALLKQSIVWRLRESLYERSWIREPFLRANRLIRRLRG